MDSIHTADKPYPHMYMQFIHLNTTEKKRCYLRLISAARSQTIIDNQTVDRKR